MINITALILAMCLIGEAGWTIMPGERAVFPEEVTTVYYEEPTYYDSYYEEPETFTEVYPDDGDWEYLGTQRVTGYTWTGNTMANGIYPSYGWCACNGLSLGAQIYIDGLGYFTVGDRGGMTDAYWVDIYFDTPSECYAVTGYYDIWVVH